MKNNNQEKLVTIVLPVYNCERTVEVAIKSILLQTYSNFELIIIDDGSTDNSLSIIKKINDSRITVISDGENKGRGARANQAVQIGKGYYFANMDADDVSFTDRIEKQVGYMEANSEVDLLGTGLMTFKGDGVVVGKTATKCKHKEICCRPWIGIYLSNATILGKIGWFRNNPYCADLLRAEDQELWLRSYKYSHFESLKEILYGYRIEHLSLKKILRERYIFTKAAIKYALSASEFILLTKLLLINLMKSFVEIVAIGSGLDYKILRHRALLVDSNVIKKWQEVWKKCNE